MNIEYLIVYLIRKRSFSACSKVCWKLACIYTKLGKKTVKTLYPLIHRYIIYMANTVISLFLASRLVQRVLNLHVIRLIIIPFGTIYT